MSRVFHGRAVLPGTLEGEAVVTHAGFNAYASFYNSLDDGVASAECADSGNLELHGRRLVGRIVCLPSSTGSTSSGAVWQRLAGLGVAPKAMLFSRSIDPLAAGGLIVADVWAGKRIVTIDQLDEAFLWEVQTGDRIAVLEDGTVVIR